MNDAKEKTTLFVRKRKDGWCVETDKGLRIALFANQELAVDRTLDMVNAFPGQYGICVEDEPTDLIETTSERIANLNPAKRQESIRDSWHIIGWLVAFLFGMVTDYLLTQIFR